MNELRVNTEDMTVSARDLHKAVGTTERFSTWFERQLQYGFEEGIDFVGCKEFNTLARQELQDYRLTADCAKQICMIQRTDAARQVRQYLIDLEKAWNTPEQIMARALKVAENTIESLKLEVTEMKPKALFAEAVETSKTSILVGELAKLLKQNGVEIGQNRLFAWLRENGYLVKNSNMPTQKSMELQLFEIKERTVMMPNGSSRITKTPKVTGKGQTYFVNKFLGSSIGC